MKKHLLIVLILLWISNAASAQSAIARLKYEDAEMAYTKKDFKSALASLKEAEVLLKSTNPKLLHLKILTMFNMLETLLDFRFDPEYVAEIKEDSAYYLKTYENMPDNEDKYREVYEVSKSINNHNKFGRMLKNALEGDNKSQDSLGVIYDNRKRMDRSTYWFNKAIEGGNTSAMRHMGIAAQYTENDKTKAINYYEMAANKGDNIAMNFLGYLYEKEKNYEKAIYWYTKAADTGNLIAARDLAELYFSGEGVLQSDTKALIYYHKAILLTPKYQSDSTSLAKAYDDMVTLYYYGDDIPKDYKKVEEYANKNILLKDTNTVVNSMIHLADIYRTGGYGIQQDYIKAFNYYSSAIKVEEGGKGYYGLALLYKNGLGVKKDRSKAQEYTQKAIMLLNKKLERQPGLPG